jgi:predicted O-methyltransferase YrrM
LKNKGFQNYELVQGDILETLPKYVENNPAQKIALLHIDVDVYEPTMEILEQLWDKVVQGGIVMLDDYSSRYGETVAVDEFFKDKNITIQKPPFNFIPAYIVKG